MLPTQALLEKNLHERYLAMLNIFRYVRQEAFRRAYELCTDIDKTKVNDLINNHDIISIGLWTKQILRKHNEYDHLDVRYLRDLAQDKNISGYSTMSRQELIINLLRLKKEPENVSAAH